MWTQRLEYLYSIVVASWSLGVANFFYHDPLNMEGTHIEKVGGGGVVGHREATRLGVQSFMEYFEKILIKIEIFLGISFKIL